MEGYRNVCSFIGFKIALHEESSFTVAEMDLLETSGMLESLEKSLSEPPSEPPPEPPSEPPEKSLGYSFRVLGLGFSVPGSGTYRVLGICRDMWGIWGYRRAAGLRRGGFRV